jgi:hypothetical protein
MQSEHQTGSLPGFSSVLESVIGVAERGFGISEEPQHPWSHGQGCHPLVLAKAGRQRPLFSTIVKRCRLIEMRSCFRNLSSQHQRTAQVIVPKHSGKRGTLLLSKLQNVDSDLATYVGIKCHDVRDEGTIENLKQRQRVTGGFSERISLLKQKTRLLNCRFGLRRGISFDMDERSDTGNL